MIKRRAVKIEKRVRLAGSAVILSSFMLFSTFFDFGTAPIFIVAFVVVTYFFAYISLIEKISKIGWLTLFLMPVLLTLAFYFFYFLFPSRWLTRLPFTLFYGISIYALLLCSNIFSIGIERNIQLYRAAFSINFLYQIVISFIFFNVIFSFRENFFFNFLAVGLITFILALQLYWTVRLEKFFDRPVFLLAFLSSVFLGQLSTFLSFLPLRPISSALFLAGSFYSLAGLLYHHLDKRLFKETIREYLIVWGFILIITLFSFS